MKERLERVVRSLPPSIWAILIAYAACSALVFRYGTDFQDEGLLYQHGLRLARGELPYRDFYIMQAPGTFYIEAALIKIFGVSMLLGRIVKQIEGVVAIVLTYRLVMRAVRNQTAAVATAAVAAAWSGALHMRFHWYTMDATLCVLVALYWFVRFVRSDERRWLAAAGLGVGASVLFKQNVGLSAAAAMGAMAVLEPTLATWCSPRPRERPQAAVADVAVFAATAVLPVAAFLTFFSMRGGHLADVWRMTIIAPQRSYEQHSLWITLIHPLRVFLLVARHDWYAYCASAAFVAAIPLLVVRATRPWPARLLAAAVLLFILVWDVETSARIIIYPLMLAVLITALVLVAVDYRDNPDRTAACRLALVVIGFATLYGGLVTGGGWARLTELLTATFAVFAMLGDVAMVSPRIRPAWERRFACAPETAIRIWTLAAVCWAALMLVDNRGFRPWIDLPLYRLSTTMDVDGARGIIGYGPFVADTDAVTRYLRRRLAEKRADDIFVFPLNCMLYPLAHARNPTRFDTLQTNPFVPELVPALVDQLEARPPSLVVMQKIANPTLAPPLESEKVWVVPESVSAVRAFLAAGRYRKEFDSTFYEVFARPGRGDARGGHDVD